MVDYFKYILFVAIMPLLLGTACHPLPDKSYEGKIQAYRDSVDRVFADKMQSVLLPEDRKNFQGLNYFPIDSNYRCPITFESDTGEWFKMPTTTDRLVWYRKYGVIHFVLFNDSFRLAVYQNMEQTDSEYADYLFCPFTDPTNGSETYGGGRYLDLRTSDLRGGFLDFNMAYNPYCAYNYKYSCPIPPKENKLNIAIQAGVKTGFR